MQSTKQAIFKLGEEEYGIDIRNVNAVEEFIALEPVTDAPQNVKGCITLRGNQIPVYSLRKMFNMQDKEPNDDTRLMITTMDGMMIAFEVDVMQEIIEFEPDEVYEVPDILRSSETSYIKNVAKRNDRVVLFLDDTKLITEIDKSKLKDLMK